MMNDEWLQATLRLPRVHPEAIWWPTGRHPEATLRLPSGYPQATLRLARSEGRMKNAGALGEGVRSRG